MIFKKSLPSCERNLKVCFLTGVNMINKFKFLVVAWLSGAGLFQFLPTVSAQPAATTLAATGIGQTNATLHGTVNPNGALATAYYQYGLTTNYDNLVGF